MTLRCRPLDVADVRAFIPTGPLPPADLLRSGRAALASHAFDGPARRPGIRDAAPSSAGPPTTIDGDHTIIKLQHREHERLATLLRLESLRTAAGIAAPRLLDHGSVPASAGTAWWTVLERRRGRPSSCPRPEQQEQLGRQLRSWHDHGPAGGLSLDAPGGLGVLLGTPRCVVPGAYPELAALFDAACAGQPLTAIHGDVAVGHNALFEGGELIAVIDPGGVDIGPPMLDLAWALAVDLPHGAAPEPLFAGYGADRIDHDCLGALLPLMMLRRLVDTALGGARDDTRWIAGWLDDRAPRLLGLVAAELLL